LPRLALRQPLVDRLPLGRAGDEDVDVVVRLLIQVGGLDRLERGHFDLDRDGGRTRGRVQADDPGEQGRHAGCTGEYATQSESHPKLLLETLNGKPTIGYEATYELRQRKPEVLPSWRAPTNPKSNTR